jgi:chromosome condensin MukBEF MukE localization factor
METIIIFLLLVIIGMLIAYAIVSTEIYNEKVDKLEKEIYDTKRKLNEQSNKLRLVKNEVDNTDLKESKYLELYNSYKRIKKVIANAHTSTITKD